MFKTRYWSMFIILGILGIGLAFLLCFGKVFTNTEADPRHWYVSPDGNDRNSCESTKWPCLTIAAAIEKAGEMDVIHIEDGWYYENLKITKEISLSGDSMGQTILDGGKNGPVISFNGKSNPDGLDLNLSDMTLTGGAATRGGGLKITGGRSVHLQNVKIIGNTANDRGGGIYSNYAHLLVLDNVEVLDNTSVNEGGGVYFIGGPLGYSYYAMETLGSTVKGNKAARGGGIYADGILNVTNSVISENEVSEDGGGIYSAHETNIILSKINDNRAALKGGAVCNEDVDLEGKRVYVADSTLDGNRALDGGGIYNRGELILKGSAVTNNQALRYGGGIWTAGVGVGLSNSFYSINSTLSGNKAEDGGGIWGGEIKNTGLFTGHIVLVNLTIVNNLSDGIYIHAGTLNIKNVLLSQNGGVNCDFKAEVTQKHNLSDDETCDAYIVANPVIGPLQDNGGVTLTHKLLPGSPAIDRAIDTAGLFTDQRNYPRPRDGSWDNISDMDIGSYEADYPTEP
jgi:predicted outer membrane repeat protein